MVQGGQITIKVKIRVEERLPGAKEYFVRLRHHGARPNVLVADGDFDWDDLGNWTSLENHIKADAAGNCVDADFIHVDAARNIIFDTRSKKNRKPIAVAGLRDCIVVTTDDTTMIAHKHASQKVRELAKLVAGQKAFKHLA